MPIVLKLNMRQEERRARIIRKCIFFRGKYLRQKYNKEEIGEAGWSTSVLALCHFCKEEEVDVEEKEDTRRSRTLGESRTIPHICHGRADGVRVNFFCTV